MATMTEIPAQELATTTHGFAIEPESVGPARHFAEQYIASRTGLPVRTRLGDGHIENVAWLVSELLTNAIRYGGGNDDRTPKNVTLDISVWTKWTHLRVWDRDHKVYRSAGDIERGRGMTIVEALAERWWWQFGLISKAMNAVILREGVELTAPDKAILDRLENGEDGDE